MTTPADQPTEPYAAQMNPLSYVCQRCAALVHFSDEAKALHNEFHASLDSRDAWEAEQRERDA